MRSKKSKELIINEKRFFWLLLLWILIFSIIMINKIVQNDTFYTIKIGELILNNGIDMIDHFSIHNLLYTYPHWLYDVFIYLVFKIGNFSAIYVSTVILNMILLSTIFMSTKKITKKIIPAFFVTLMTAIVMGGYATARAQLVTYILFALELYFIEDYIKNRRIGNLIGLFLISLLMCNIHVAVWPFFFILFLPFIGEGIISIIIKKMKRDNKFTKFLKSKFDMENDIPLKELILVMMLCTLTGLITPIKDTPYVYLYKTMMGNSQKYIMEHQMVSFKGAIFTIVIAVEALILGIISKIKLRDLFLLLGLGLMAIVSVRHNGLLAIAIPICLARTYNYFIHKINVDIDKNVYKILKNKIVAVISFIIVIIPAMLNLKSGILDSYVIGNEYPVKAVEFIKENIDVEKMRIFNEYNYGSYLILNDIPVFIDSRADLYTKQFSGLDYDIFDDFMTILDNTEKKFDFYGITHVLLNKNNLLNYNIKQDDDYKVLYEDDDFIFYERDK